MVSPKLRSYLRVIMTFIISFFTDKSRMENRVGICEGRLSYSLVGEYLYIARNVIKNVGLLSMSTVTFYSCSSKMTCA